MQITPAVLTVKTVKYLWFHFSARLLKKWLLSARVPPYEMIFVFLLVIITLRWYPTRFSTILIYDYTLISISVFLYLASLPVYVPLTSLYGGFWNWIPETTFSIKILHRKGHWKFENSNKKPDTRRFAVIIIYVFNYDKCLIKHFVFSTFAYIHMNYEYYLQKAIRDLFHNYSFTSHKS